MNRIASCSFGKDSLAMVMKLIEKNLVDEIIYFDTGWEFSAIYNLIKKVEPYFIERGVKFTRLYPSKDFDYLMFDKPIKGRTQENHFGFGWCGGPCRWGTGEKTRAINNYLKKYDDIIEYVGIAADEPQRIKEKEYPLIKWGMSEKDCLEYCRKLGFNWLEYSRALDDYIDLYDVFDRVSCWCCANKNKKELYNMYKYFPDYWERLKVMQSKINRPFKKYKKGGVIYGYIEELEKEFMLRG